MRAFVAVELPTPELPGIRTPGEGAPSHLTLLFLGDIEAAAAAPLGASFARAVESEPPFELRLHGLGAFPSDERPRVVFVGIAEGTAELARLHDRLVAVARSHGLPVEDRPFVAHLTVLRVRSPKDAALAHVLRTRFSETPFGTTRVTELLLKSSVLGRGGPVHHVEARLPLRGGEHGDRTHPQVD